MPKAPPNSVRGRVRAWIESHAAELGDDVLEVGSRLHRPDAWWITNRDLALGQWIGMDMQPGLNVDVVADLHDLPAEWAGRFTGVVLSEVLEHVARPWLALPSLHKVMKPGALLIVTAPFCFPVHAFPDDFYRYTESGIRVLLGDAGFKDVQTANSGKNVAFALNDHGEPGMAHRNEPMHTFAVARA